MVNKLKNTSINKKLKLIYVLKIGNNSSGEGLYEFIFSENPTNIDVDGWLWDVSPACDNAEPPTKEYVDKIINLKTSGFDLFCLHEAIDREYLHGYHLIHALAYEKEKEIEGYESYDTMYDQLQENNDDVPLLVFHYGMTITDVENAMYERNIILHNNEFVEGSSIKF